MAPPSKRINEETPKNTSLYVNLNQTIKIDFSYPKFNLPPKIFSFY